MYNALLTMLSFLITIDKSENSFMEMHVKCIIYAICSHHLYSIFYIKSNNIKKEYLLRYIYVLPFLEYFKDVN